MTGQAGVVHVQDGLRVIAAVPVSQSALFAELAFEPFELVQFLVVDLFVLPGMPRLRRLQEAKDDTVEMAAEMPVMIDDGPFAASLRLERQQCDAGDEAQTRSHHIFAAMAVF